MNRYVITGGVSSGKTTLVEALARRGHATRPEAARRYIEAQLAAGRTLAEIRRDEVALQEAILRYHLPLERAVPTDRPVWLDRSPLDPLAFMRMHGAEPTVEHRRLVEPFRYDVAFLTEFTGLADDGIRTESPAQNRRLERFLVAEYEAAGIPVIRIPWRPVGERVALVLDHVSR